MQKFFFSLRPVDQQQRELVVKVHSMCYTLISEVRQGLRVGHEWIKFKIFSLHVLRNVFLKSKCLLTAKKLFKMHL